MSADIPTLETDRLHLRAPGEQDLPAYRAFYTDAEASHFYGGPLPPHLAWRQLAIDLGHWQLRGYGRWTVTDAADGTVLGGVGLWCAGGWPRRELTWWLLPPARGRGVATEASRAAIAFAYGQLGWDLVETHMDDANTRARALVDRLGGHIIAREPFPDGLTRNVYALPRPA